MVVKNLESWYCMFADELRHVFSNFFFVCFREYWERLPQNKLEIGADQKFYLRTYRIYLIFKHLILYLIIYRTSLVQAEDIDTFN
jgi:hypothetical protein